MQKTQDRQYTLEPNYKRCLETASQLGYPAIGKKKGRHLSQYLLSEISTVGHGYYDSPRIYPGR